ncbi:MAG: nicotinate-nucleotide adenylyltransferase [Opitutales bacterium]
MMAPFDNSSTGIFGGTFDPIHIGHLILARDVLEQLEIKRIIFMPASRAPLSEHEPLASNEDRYEIVRAAIRGEPRFEVSDLELRDSEINYTVDTIETLRSENPDDSFALIIGADQFEKLPQWHRVNDLIILTQLICLERPGYTLQATGPFKEIGWRSIKPRSLAVSSTEIRERIRGGLSVQHLVPETALEVIRKRGIYSA